jgi:hypothetical protein
MALLELTHASGEPTYCCPTSRERERATSIAPPLPIEAGWRSPSCWARSGCSKDNSAKGRSGSRAASAMAGESRKLARRRNASGRLDPVREFSRLLEDSLRQSFAARLEISAAGKRQGRSRSAWRHSKAAAEEGLLGQFGGVGRVAGFTARGTERGDEHDGGSLGAGA